MKRTSRDRRTIFSARRDDPPSVVETEPAERMLDDSARNDFFNARRREILLPHSL